MKKFISQSNRFIALLLVLFVIQACAPGGGSRRVVTSEQRADLEQLLKQAQQAQPAQKNALFVQVAGLLVLDKRYEKAQEVLLRVNPQYLTPAQTDDFHLFYGETLLALAAKEASLHQLQSIQSPQSRSIEWQLRYSQSLSDCYFANGNYFEAAKIRIDLEDVIDAAEMLQLNNEKIWTALNQIETPFLQSLINGFNSQRLNGWLEIVFINKQYGQDPKQLQGQLEQWKRRYPLHPAQVNQPEFLQRTANAQEFTPKQIAVLLPLSGKNAAAGAIIRDGILAAHYRRQNQREAPQLNFYDTARDLSILTPYQKAIDDGADFVLGPLTKESVESLLNQQAINVPMLALNRLEDQKYSNADVFQFGLPIEDEALQSAQRAFEKGYRKAIAFMPDNAVGRRAEQAFKTEFESLGGELIEAQYYKEASALKNNVQHLLGVDASEQRKRALQQLLGRNLEFEMRRRQDAEFIFMIASPNMGRRIKPFINYYYAHDLPVMATSMIYSGKKNPKTDIDLNGIEFPDIPLLLSELPEFTETRQTLENVEPDALDARGRFFALGFDAYQILSQLSLMRAFPDYHWHGLSGTLSIDQYGLVHRDLTWALFNRGIPNVTREQTSNAAESTDASFSMGHSTPGQR